MLCRAVLCRTRNPLPPLSTVPAQPDEPPPTHPTSKTDPISSGEVAWVRHQDSVPTCLRSHMSPPIGLSQRDGVGWVGVRGWGGGGARTIIEGVASTGWVSDARVETTTHFYTSLGHANCPPPWHTFARFYTQKEQCKKLPFFERVFSRPMKLGVQNTLSTLLLHDD